MENYFEKKENKELIDGIELDKCSCKECEDKLMQRFNPNEIKDLLEKKDIEAELKKQSKFKFYLHEIVRSDYGKLIHKENWKKIKNNIDSKYIFEVEGVEKLIFVYIKFMRINGKSYATNVGITTAKSVGSNSLGDLSFSEDIKHGVSKRLMHYYNENILDEDIKAIKWNKDNVIIIPTCCRRCGLAIEGKLRFDFNLLDT